MIGAAEFWDKHAEKYAASKIGNEAAYAHTLERTRSYLRSDMQALELGCGTGSTALELVGDLGHLTGTDVSPKMIAIAQDKAEAAALSNVTFRVSGALEAIDLVTSPDAIFGFNLLHLVPDPGAVMQRAFERLAPGGLLITKTPCLAEPAIGLKRFLFGALVPVMQLIGKAPSVHRLTFAEIEDMMTSTGFIVEEKGSFPAMSRYIVARKPI